MFQSNRKGYKGQSAEAAQAVEAFYKGLPIDRIGYRAVQRNLNERLNDQPANQEYSSNISDALIDSGLYEGFKEYELGAVADIDRISVRRK